MSAGAVFKLIANDGKADRMIMATKLLNQRIKDVMCARKKAGKADITPTLVDLERTHILYVNAHFKPFAAIGYEYNKVRPQSGNATLGSGVTYSIPQFGDFFYDMVGRTRLSAFRSSSLTTPLAGATAGTGAGGGGSYIPFPFNGTTTTGAVAANNFYNIVDACGNIIVAGVASPGPSAAVTYSNFVRYCEYPGDRLYSAVKFDVNGNPLDQYSWHVPVFLNKFVTTPNKRVGYDRLVGQEVPLQGYTGLCCATVQTNANTASLPDGITRNNPTQSNQQVALFNAVNPTAPTTADRDPVYAGSPSIADLGATPVAISPLAAGPLTAVAGVVSAIATNVPAGQSQIDVSRQLIQIVNGPQTPKPIQAPLEIWNKLRFWFNDDVRLSVPSVSIPFGQRFISIELSSQNVLAFEYPSIFLQTIVDDTAVGVGVRAITYEPIFQAGTVGEITIERMELYINNIFVNPEVHDIYIKRIGFSLIRVYREQVQRSNASADEKLLSQLKWPIEYMMVGLRPVWNYTMATASSGFYSSPNARGNQEMWHDWHRLTYFVKANCDDASSVQIQQVTGALSPSNVSSATQIIPQHYYLPVPTIDQLSLTSHGIVIYDNFQDLFYNAYTPFNYGGPSLVTPDDPGALMINMCLFPRAYNPSGHLNISRARETYINWTSSYVTSTSPADLVVVGIAINFLLITDGSMGHNRSMRVRKDPGSASHALQRRANQRPALEASSQRRCLTRTHVRRHLRGRWTTVHT